MHAHFRVGSNGYERGSQLAVCLTMAGVIFAMGGCSSGDELEKVIVRGEVRYDGQPIENGQISFFPLEETKGPMSGAPIAAGQYIVQGKGGVPVGRHRVEIEAYRASTLADDPEASEGGVRLQYLPAKFNQQSELTADVSNDVSQVLRDFDLLP